jgi:aspartate kinase
MKVIKIGGSSLNGKKAITHILDLIAERGPGHVFVLSALSGVTDYLINSMHRALQDEESIPGIIDEVRQRHVRVARYIIPKRTHFNDFTGSFEKSLIRLEGLYYGLHLGRDITPAVNDVISSYGERFVVMLMAGGLRCRGVDGRFFMPQEIGLMTDGKFGDATVDMPRTKRNFKKKLKPQLYKKLVVFIPGFFGVSREGDVTTFGRGGSDYSAAVVAAALGAERLEIWKDVDGFMSADPKMVSDARRIPVLSYEEAAELAYFGAKILHPRTVEPLRKPRLDIAVKNTFHLGGVGSLITSQSPRAKQVVKSVSHSMDIAILKVYGSGVGARPGILGIVANQVAVAGINIKSVVTSQTCISLLLGQRDLDAAHAALKRLKPRPFRQLEKVDDVALVSIVGEGLLRRKGIAARCFTAAAERSVNVEMISFGPSPVALYFIVRHKDLKKTLNAIHDTFFQDGSIPNSKKTKQ